jgi:hypothetical protein
MALLLLGPLLVAAVVLAVLRPAWGVPPWAPAGGAAALALLLAALLWLVRRGPVPAHLRALEHSWTQLVPRLPLEDAPGKGLPLAAGLAEVSIGRGSPEARAEVLAWACAAADRAARADPRLAVCAGALTRLVIEDNVAAGDDPAPVLARQVARCFEGKLPLGFAAGLLRRWGMPWWTAGKRRRLRVLLCARAFEAGLEVRDLLDLGSLCAELGAVLDVEDGDALGQLGLLWSLRAGHDWEEAGKAATAFEVAERAAGEPLLEKHPDLLLAVRGTPPLYVCAGGVWLEETCYEQEPAGGALPHTGAERLKRWLGYYFREFRPQLAAVSGRHSGAAMARLLECNGVQCPECRRRLLPRAGEVGITTEEGAGQTAAVPG